MDAYNYYFDSTAEKTRYIILNTAKRKRSDEQIRFIVKALKSMQKDWNMIVVAHIWVEWDKNIRKYLPNEQTDELMKIFDKYNHRMFDGKYDFRNVNGRVACLIGGHIHNDFRMQTRGGIELLLFDSDAASKSCSKYRPVRGLPSEQCVTVLILDYENKKGYAVRFGRGKNLRFSIA